MNARARESALERLAHLLDERLALPTLLRHLLRERAVLLWLEVLERQVLELPAQPRHTEAVRKRRIKVPSFRGDASTLLVRQVVERAHVVKPVCQLHDDDASILRDRQQKLAIALDLPILL